MKKQNEEDCPEILVKMARTKWQKAVALEFLSQNRKITEMKKDLKWVKWLSMGVFAAVFFSVLVNLMV